MSSRLVCALLLAAVLSGAAEVRSEPLPEGAKGRLGTLRFRHGAVIHQLALSPDGKLLATSGYDRVVRVWDAITGQPVASCDPTTSQTYLLAFSPDGKSLAGFFMYNGLRVWDSRTGKLRWSASQQGTDACMSWSPDGKLIGCGGRDGIIRLLEADTGKLVRAFPRQTGIVYNLQFLPDGKQVVGISSDATIRRWDVATGQVSRQRNLRETGVYFGFSPQLHSFSADGKQLAMLHSDRGLRIWNVEDDTPARVIPNPSAGQASTSVRFTPDGRFLLLASNSGSVSIWGASSGRELRSFRDTRGRTPTLALTPDSKTLVIGRGNSLELWDVGTGNRREDDHFPDSPVRDLVFLKDNRGVVSLHDGGILHAWDVARARVTAVATERCNIDGGLNVLPSGKGVRVHSYSPSGWLDWEPGGVSELRSTRPSTLFPLSPDGRTLIQLEGGRPVLIDVATGQELRKLSDPLMHQRVVFAADGQRFAGRTPEGLMRVWEVESGQGLALMSPAPEGPAGHGITLLPPGGRTLVQMTTNQVRVWETISGRERLRHALGNRPVTAGTLSADGRLLVFGLGTGEVIGLDLDTGKEVVRRVGHAGPVRCLRFSPDGKLLASGGEDTTILLWDASAFQAAPPGKEKSSGAELARLWDELTTDDAGRAYRGIQGLAGSPEEALPLLREKLRPVKEDLGRRINRLVAQLDDKRFTKREAATRELGEIGLEAQPALEKALASANSLDLKRRIEELLVRFRSMPSGQRIRTVRALEALERMGTPAARAALTDLAGGEPGAWLTREAKAILERMGN